MEIFITTQKLPVGYIGECYMFQLTAQVDPPSSVQWEALNRLPKDLVLDKNSGIIQGICNEYFWGTLQFIVQNIKTKEEAFCTLELLIDKKDHLIIDTSSLPDGTINTPYKASLIAKGGVPPYYWTVEELPNGLQQSKEQISGIPVSPCNINLKVRVKDSSIPQKFDKKDIPIRINPDSLRIITDSLVSGIVGEPFSQCLLAYGGIPPYKWSVQSLPSGLFLEDGYILGVPLQAGNFSSTILVTDSDTQSSKQSKTFSMSILSPDIQEIRTEVLRPGNRWRLYSIGGIPPYVWSVDKLPDGFSIDGNLIHGWTLNRKYFEAEIIVKDSKNHCFSTRCGFKTGIIF